MSLLKTRRSTSASTSMPLLTNTKTPLGEMKQIKRQLQFIYSIRFMSSSLDLLSRNLVRVNGMMCEGCGNEANLTHIDENYATHGMCEKCQGVSH